MAPELKNEGNLKVDDAEANLVVSKECRKLQSLCVSSNPETRACADVIDSVSLPTKFSKIDYIDPFKSEIFNISVTIEGNNFRALLDTGAAATAVSAKVWDV